MELATDSAISQRKQWLARVELKPARSPMAQENAAWWSGFDVRYLAGHKLAKRTSNPKLH
jgi:hypothetical protein